MADQDTWTAVDNFFGAFIESDDALTGALRSSASAHLPEIQVTPPQGKLLHLFVRMTQARRILEIGTLGGYSTIWMGRALPPGGHIVTLELDPTHVAIAHENIARAGLTKSITIRQGAALDTLAQLAHDRVDPFDFVFIDADKHNIPGYFTSALALTRPGSVIIVDNVVRKGAVVNAKSTDADVIGVRAFQEMVVREPRVTATTIQTVGMKGYDGFTIMIVL